MNQFNSSYQNPVHPVVRNVPYPYRAMLAICSDLDETPDGAVYYEIMRYLNTTESTSMGPGVGLEVGNTIYFDMPPGQFAYWSADEPGREMVRTLIRSGHIDCLHSFGDLATSRQHVERALDELVRHDCRLSVWIDHATAPTNFGSDIMQGQGDVPESPVYHADLTCDYGLQYVWRGRVTSVIGQDVDREFSPIWSAKHPFSSAQTLGKELLKNCLARCGSNKYSMHRTNALARETSLRSGQPVTEFIRCNPYWGGVGKAATAGGLAEVLVDNYFSTLSENGGFSILYTHLGKITNLREPFELPTRKGWDLLASYYRNGQILVSTTKRLLTYRNAVKKAQLASSMDGEWQTVQINSDSPVADLAGMTIYVNDPAKTRVFANNHEMTNLRRNPADSSGRPSVSVPWVPLQFPGNNH
jgi:hypothetical protein